MGDKIGVALNIAIIVLALILTISYMVAGEAIVAIGFGIIMLLNCVGLFLRKNKIDTDS